MPCSWQRSSIVVPGARAAAEPRISYSAQMPTEIKTEHQTPQWQDFLPHNFQHQAAVHYNQALLLQTKQESDPGKTFTV